jgi:hypothetical protein
MGIDWGGTDEHSVGLWQLLEVDVVVTSYKSGTQRVQRAGTLVRFDEVYEKGIGNIQLGTLARDMERRWQLKYPGWHVKERYPDYANRAARDDWRDELGMPTVSYIKKDFPEEVKLVRTRVSGLKFAVAIDRCPVFNRAIKAWRQVNGHEVHDWASHPLAEFRYVEHNLHEVERRAGKRRAQSETNQPAAADGEEIARAVEREQEMRKAHGQIVVTRHGAVDLDEEVMDEVGAVDSPLVAEFRQDRVVRSAGRDWGF